MKKFSFGVIFGLLVGLLIGTASFAIANQPIKLIVNGQEIQCDVPPQNINGRVLVPARFVAESLGASVEWDEGNNAVVVKSETKINSNGNIHNNLLNNVNNTKEVKTLRNYYIQGDIPCIEYDNIVYTPVLAGINYYKIPLEDYTINESSIIFIKINKTFNLGNIQNKDDCINYNDRIYIKEDILKTYKNY